MQFALSAHASRTNQRLFGRLSKPVLELVSEAIAPIEGGINKFQLTVSFSSDPPNQDRITYNSQFGLVVVVPTISEASFEGAAEEKKAAIVLQACSRAFFRLLPQLRHREPSVNEIVRRIRMGYQECGWDEADETALHSFEQMSPTFKEDDGLYLISWSDRRASSRTIPNLIPIRPEGQLRWTGRYAKGICLGYVLNHDGEVWSVCHVFSSKGKYRETKVLRDKQRSLLDELFAELPGWKPDVVEVGLFEDECEGVLFALKDTQVTPSEPTVELIPLNVGFAPPWDGVYDS